MAMLPHEYHQALEASKAEVAKLNSRNKILEGLVIREQQRRDDYYEQLQAATSKNGALREILREIRDNPERLDELLGKVSL